MNSNERTTIIQKERDHKLLSTALKEGGERFPDRSMRTTGGPSKDSPESYLAQLSYHEGCREAYEFMRDRLLELFQLGHLIEDDPEVEDEETGAIPVADYLEALNVRSPKAQKA